MICSKMKYQAILIAAGLALSSGLCHAGVENDVPSCYGIEGISVPSPDSQHELFLLIDQTTPFDDKLRQSIRENAGRLIVPGASYVVASFSSYGDRRYFEVISAGKLESPLTPAQRDSTKRTAIPKFDACMKSQAAYGRKTAATAINKALESVSGAIPQSDVASSLQRLALRVRASKAVDKVVFIASDMLENSSISSFYAGPEIRTLQPEQEIQKFLQKQAVADFGPARVYVLGAGLLAQGKDAQKSYRKPETIQALNRFWQLYFSKSQASLDDFGAPTLVNPITWR
ncbi:MAG TPA: hypothetical protein VGE55_01905 [Limnobacter sp.]|uniref:hypothetical protein n=1 Tax=Limnobacter sp. TaxID=2003368 RepID=UPI002ED855B6